MPRKRVVALLCVFCTVFLITGCGYILEPDFIDDPGSKWLCTQVSGCILWLDAGSITGVSDGSSLDTWPDLSGNGNNATAAGADRPTFFTGIQNGRPAVYFSGTNQHMALTSAVNMQPATVFAVVSYAAPSTNAPFLGHDTNSAFFGYYNNTIYYYSTSASLNRAKTNPLTFEIITGHAQPAGNISAIRTNGADYWTGSFNWGTSSFLYIARRNAERFRGYVAEIVCYNRALDSSEIQLVETYLNGKYGVY